MKYEETTWFSTRLNRNMNIKIYGHYGVPVILFPSFNKDNTEFHDNGMIDAIADYINDGKIKLFCLQSNDSDTVASTSWDNNHRAHLLEQYFEYLIQEVLPFVYDKNGGHCLPLVSGVSMGASHAAIAFFRRPDLFMGILGLSGGYDVAHFFNGYMNSDIYNNSPTTFLENMDRNHEYIGIYNSKKMIFVCGQGSFEHLVLYANYWLRDILNYKNIEAWYDILDNSNIHDWSSWNKQMHHYLQFFIN